MVNPGEFKPENLVVDLEAVSFKYKNGTTLTFRDDALIVWSTFYRLLVTIHDSLAKAATTKPDTPQAPAINLADELKKRS